MQSRSANPWIQRPRPQPGAAIRLICLPYAGGGASVFRGWPDGLPAEVEVLAVALPGREARIKEPLFDRLPPLLAALADALAPELNRPYAIFGHSLGAMLGFYLARELRRRGHRAPLHLFASGRRAPQLPDMLELQGAHELSDPRFIEAVARFGGVPDALLERPELMAMFLPMLRADFAVHETAAFVPDEPLGCPITALGGSDDASSTTVADLEAWGAHTRGGFEYEVIPGNHFFLQTARDAVLGVVSRRLQPSLAAARAAL
jgi:medium-chain acyl-[acyl-carrier-protein] hydrolase